MSSTPQATEHYEPTEASVDPRNRRAAPRAPFELAVDFTGNTNFYTGFTEDISEGGLFIATVMLQEPGSRVNLSFTLPDEHEVTAVGIVRWVRDPRDDNPDCVAGMGIQFEGLCPDDLAHICEFVALREPMFFEH